MKTRPNKPRQKEPLILCNLDILLIFTFCINPWLIQISSNKGEILDFLFTQGNVDDREPLNDKNFHDKIFGKLFGDKGYISKIMLENLQIDFNNHSFEIYRNTIMIIIQERT